MASTIEFEDAGYVLWGVDSDGRFDTLGLYFPEKIPQTEYDDDNHRIRFSARCSGAAMLEERIGVHYDAADKRRIRIITSGYTRLCLIRTHINWCEIILEAHDQSAIFVTREFPQQCITTTIADNARIMFD